MWDLWFSKWHWDVFFLSAVALHQSCCSFIRLSEHLRFTQYGLLSVTAAASYCWNFGIFSYY